MISLAQHQIEDRRGEGWVEKRDGGGGKGGREKPFSDVQSKRYTGRKPYESRSDEESTSNR